MNLLTFNPLAAMRADVVLAQRSLAALGLYHGLIDGDPGKKTLDAFGEYKAIQKSPVTGLNGDGTWPFKATIVGNDILLVHVRATAFGGDHDNMDSGKTASGYNTAGHPGLIACSLPMRTASMPELRGSPVPRMPFGLKPNGDDNPNGAHVEITFLENGLVVPNVPVVDLGPGKRTGNAIDLAVAVAKKRDARATANNFSAPVTCRIIGGAKWANS